MLGAMLIDSVHRIGLTSAWVETVLVALFLEGFCEIRSIDMCIHWHRYGMYIIEEIYLNDGGMYYIYDLSDGTYIRHDF